MVKGLLGKKIGMSQMFEENGTRKPVTVLQVKPGFVVQIKNEAKDGYAAVQLGFDALPANRAKKISKPLRGQFKEVPAQKFLKEFAAEDISKITLGQEFNVSLFQAGELVDVAGISKGRGFQGVMKRHNFAGGPASHGHRFHRTGGSIGQRKFPGRVFKNKRMPGHMGNVRKTIQNILINRVDAENHLLYIVGSVPGGNGSYVEVKKATKSA